MTGPAQLGETFWPKVDAATLLVPLGSVEQHGPHLPLDTDTRIAVAVATRAAAAAGPDAVVAPPLPYGASGEHEGFPGTVSIGTAVLTAVLVELVRSATRTFTRVVLVSGHGGNLEGVRAAVQSLQAESRDVVACFPAVRGGDAHAGRTETSLLLAIAPELVGDRPWAAGALAPMAELMPRLRLTGVRPVSGNGVLGNPDGANPAEGARMLDLLANQLRALIAGPRPAGR